LRRTFRIGEDLTEEEVAPLVQNNQTDNNPRSIFLDMDNEEYLRRRALVAYSERDLA